MSDKTIIRTTCPRDCYDACGIAVVKRADGLVKVLGDPEHAQGLAGKDQPPLLLHRFSSFR